MLPFLVLILSILPVGAQITIDSITTTPADCGGESSGSITVNISNGTGPYNYTLFRGATPVQSSGITDSTHFTFNGLIKSLFYLVIVEDGDPVIIGFDSDNAFVDGPSPISILTYNTTDITCNGNKDGIIEVTATGEGENLIYELSGPDPRSNEDGIFRDLPEGINNYQVTVSDKDGCPSTDVTPLLTINEPSAVTVVPDVITHVDCYGDNTGAITIIPGGGSPSGGGSGYTYEWTGPGGPFATTQNVTNLEAGDYYVTVYDGNLCSADTGPIEVNQEAEITATRDYLTDVSCNGGNDGTSRVTAGGGVGGYSYSWDGQAFGLISTQVDPDNLIADTYDLTIFDANSCSKIFTSFAVIDEPDPIEVEVDNTFDATCWGYSDGSAAISPSGGTGPYSFTWSGTIPVPAYSSALEDPDNMPADLYSLSITDDNNCSESFPDLLTIGQPSPVSVVFNSSTDVTCFGGNNGTADVTVSGGTIPYNFDWTGDLTGHNSGAEDPDDLVADMYNLVVTDNNSCEEIIDDIVEIEEPADLAVVVDNIIHVDCNGEQTGAVEIIPSGGTPAYSYAWTGPSGPLTTQNISGLGAGAYSLTMTDANLCSKDFINVATVNENTGISATFDLTDVSCNGGSDGAINASVLGGTPNYIYDWTGPGGPYPATEDLSGLDTGSYQLTVTDDLGCIEVFPVQTLNQPPAISASATTVDVDCFGAGNGSIDLSVSGGTPGFTFAWTGPGGPAGNTEDITDLDPGAYSVNVTDANLCSILFTDIAIVSQPAEIQVTSVKTDISCAGSSDGAIDITVTGGTEPYNFDWTGPGGPAGTTEDIADLAAGSYSLTITDGNGCIVDFPDLANIIEPDPVIATYVIHQDVICNGDNDGSIEIDVTGGIMPLTFDWTNSQGLTQSTIEDPVDLEAETYSLTITDANGCSASFPDLATIDEPPVLSASLAGTNVLCYGEGNGSITVTASGGTPDYEYSRAGDFDPAYQAGDSFTGLDPGFYTIWTRDANKCVVTDTVTIQEPEEILVLGETKSGQNLCYGDSSAQISIDQVTGGVLPYQYSINGGADFFTTSLFINLPAGNYQTVVKDASGCLASGNLNNITQPSMLWIETYNQTDINSCYNALDGKIFIVGKGGTGIKTYTLNDTLTNLSGDFQNLPHGLHKITITDENACTRDTFSVILSPPEIVVDNLTTYGITGCPGDETGSLVVEASGGIAPLFFSVDGNPFQGIDTFSNLKAGDHTLTIKDSSVGGCTRDTVFSITEPEPIAILSELITHIACAGDSNGIIEIIATGGTPDLSYTLNPGGVSNSTGIFNGLAQDIPYIVTVDDSEHCGPVNSNPITIIEPPVLIIDSVISNSISCNGAGDGTIIIYASGGVPPYQYSVDDGASWLTDSAFEGLTPDTFEIFVMDANLCILSSDTIILTDPPQISVSVTPTHITTCSGDTTGAIEALATGGTGPLEYSLDGMVFQSSGIFSNLPGGDALVYVRDSTGCMVSEPVTINEPDSVLATIIKTDAVNGNPGTIVITESRGGTPPYSYTIDGPAGIFTTDTVYTDLEAGFYHVIVMDASNCPYEEMVTIRDVLPLNVILSMTDVTCFGDNDGSIEFIPQDAEGAVEYSIDSGQNFVAEALFGNLPGNRTYYLAAMDSAGKVFNDSVTIYEPAAIALSSEITAAECNNFSETGAIDITVSGGTGTYTYLWSNGSTDEDLSNIVSGDYTLEIKDSAGCTLNENMTVYSIVIITADAGKDTSICYGESVQLQGTSENIPSWSPVTFLTDPDISNPVAVGVTQTTTYVLTIKEEVPVYGCYNTDTVTITTYPLTGIDVTPDTSIVIGSSIQLEATGGPFLEYRWDPETGLDNSTIFNPVASPQQSIMYTVYGTNENGCEESDSVYITVIEGVQLQPFNVFSPNNDGINDYFDIENASFYPEVLVEVYSRWGELIFSTVGYDDGSRWDGTTRGKDAPIGTYYYIIIPESGAEPITGNVTIIR